jgi:hypothetical protein
MRIANPLLKCVGFVSRYEPDDEGGSRLQFGATAFIVGVTMEGNVGLAHLVTAKHVVEQILPRRNGNNNERQRWGVFVAANGK